MKVAYRNSEVSALVDEYVHNQRDRDILRRRLIDGVSFDDLSDEFGLSVQRLKAIVYEHRREIFSHL